MIKTREIINMTRDEVKESIKEFPVMIFPIGATEQHGHHLPLGVDIFLAEGISKKLSEKTGALLIPTMPFGYSWVWRNIPGTISLEQDHIEVIIKDVARSVHRYGVKLLILVGGHDANNASMKYAVRELEDEIDLKIIYLFYPNLSKVINDYCESDTWFGMIHACEFETSLMISIKPDLVQMDKAVKEYPERPMLYGMSTISLGDISNSGVFGNPVLASKEKGDSMIDYFVEEMSNLILIACKEMNIVRG